MLFKHVHVMPLSVITNSPRHTPISRLHSTAGNIFYMATRVKFLLLGEMEVG
jgi:hypothetical protein